MSKHGGKRKGAGRKPKPAHLKRKAVAFKLPLWLVEWMRSNNNAQSKLIEDALFKKYGHVIYGGKTKENG